MEPKSLLCRSSNNNMIIPRNLLALSISAIGFSVFLIVTLGILSSNTAVPSIHEYVLGPRRPSGGSLGPVPNANNTTMIVPKAKVANNISSPNATQPPNLQPEGGSKIGSKSSVDGSKKPSPGSCDLYRGKWVYDPDGPLLYTNNSCPILSQPQNCQGNGRPDKEYENWRWKPHQCDLPSFDARRFLEMMRGKTIAFVGDSIARNQMESLVCILWQVEAPKKRGRRGMQRWFFASTSTWIIRIWSSWLVHRTNGSIEYAPEGLDKVHLDTPDEKFMQHLLTMDVLVLSSGHWMTKPSAYILRNKVVGGQGWWWTAPHNNDSSSRLLLLSKKKKMMNNVAAYGTTVETALSAISRHPNYTGLAILRTYSPDHYEGGGWNAGGSCTEKTKPLAKVVRNGFTDAMHGKQVSAFRRAAAAAAAKKMLQDGPRLRLMDITEMFSYRHDGHPGQYRSTDPNKPTERGLLDGKPPPQDCLHWCMPGPVDTWNELLMETIRRDFN